MKLSEILKGLSFECPDLKDTDIKDIVYDSRKAEEGTLFVCLVGAFTDGHKYIQGAYDKGCRAFLCSEEVSLPEDATVIYTDNTRSALATVSCNFFCHPSREIKVIGITGTKGKTTTAHIVKFVLEQAGIKTGIIGTVGSFYGDVTIPTVNTTPESYELQKTLRLMAQGGCEAVVMEVSSLGLKHHRVEGTEFFCGVFTNLFPDHIGTNEHESFEEYAYWKTMLFPLCKKAIVNIDDGFADTIIRSCAGEVITYGYEDAADYRLLGSSKVKLGNVLATEFSLSARGEEKTFTVALPGQVNAHNSLIALAIGDIFGVSDKDSAEGLRRVFVRGRGEIVRESEDFTVIIDYAHNGVSLKSIIDTAKEYDHGRIITLFGSVGGRTECRRQELGSVSGKLSDFSVITSDDPNYEEPMKICLEIAEYCKAQGGEYTVIPDRGEAISFAVKMAKKGDILILAGKGHEKFMKICGEDVPFDERAEVIRALKEKKEGK